MAIFGRLTGTGSANAPVTLQQAPFPYTRYTNLAGGRTNALGAYVFGGVMIAQLFIQGSSAQIEVPSQFLSALPYAATIVVLVLISRNPNTIRLNSPASLGQPYRPDA